VAFQPVGFAAVLLLELAHQLLRRRPDGLAAGGEQVPFVLLHTHDLPGQPVRLASGWPDDQTRTWLLDRATTATTDRDDGVRLAAARALVIGWPDDPRHGRTGQTEAIA
jgi:hypothetical protein